MEQEFRAIHQQTEEKAKQNNDAAFAQIEQL